MATYCPQCGAPANNTTVCEYCGAAIPAQQPATPAQPVYQQPVYQQPVYQQPVYQQPPVYQQNAYNANLPVKSRIVAAVLAFLLGGLGIHKFYLGKTTHGILMLCFCWTYIPSIIAFIDFIVLLCTNDQDFMAKYNCRIG